MYQIKNLNHTFNLNSAQQQTFADLAHDLQTLKDHAPFLDDIVVWSGFLLDTILGVEPHDIDAFYSTKEQVGQLFQTCKCRELREIMKNLEFKLFDQKHELDLGHYGEGEVYVPIVEKAVGYHSHLIDLADMICLDSHGDLWGHEEAVNCIQNRLHEVRYDGWILFSYFVREFPYTDYYYFCTLNIFRGLKMIHTKNYLGVGPNYRTLLDNCEPILNYTSKVPPYREALRKYRAKKASFMGKNEIEHALAIAKTTKAKYILEVLSEMLGI